jgi:hypothetical protein
VRQVAGRWQRLSENLRSGIAERRVAPAGGKIEFGLLERLSQLLLCGRCLRHGRKTPVRQVISHRHRPRSLCTACSAEAARRARRLPAPLLIY